MLWCFHISHWPNGLCRFGNDKCDKIALEANNNVFVISSNTRCAGAQFQQLHDFIPSSFKTGRHSQWWSSTLHLMHLWAQLHRQSLFGICASKSGSCWINISSCWPSAVWLQLLLHPYQLIVDCYNLFSCNGAVVLRMCWHVTTMVAITIIVIVKWHWRMDVFNGLTMLIVALSVMLAICSCVTRTMQFSGSTSLVPEVLCTFQHQLYGKCDVTTAFLPHQCQSLAQGLIIVMTLVTNVASSCGALGTPKIGSNQCWNVISLSLWVSLPLAIGSVINHSGRMMSWHCTLHMQGIDWWCSMHISILICTSFYTLWKRIESFNEYYLIIYWMILLLLSEVSNSNILLIASLNVIDSKNSWSLYRATLLLLLLTINNRPTRLVIMVWHSWHDLAFQVFGNAFVEDKSIGWCCHNNAGQ